MQKPQPRTQKLGLQNPAFEFMNYTRCERINNQRFTQSGCKDIRISKLHFGASAKSLLNVATPLLVLTL